MQYYPVLVEHKKGLERLLEKLRIEEEKRAERRDDILAMYQMYKIALGKEAANSKRCIHCTVTGLDACKVNVI